MNTLIKPPKLQKGDKVATVSISWGGAGDKDLLWRYSQGKERLENLFGLKVIKMPNTLKGSEYLYNHPEKRAEDLMTAFSDKSIRGVFSCIGGDESIRILPYIDFDVIKNNPKVFIGYSDTTIAHMMCLKAGISSFYGPSILSEFSENVDMHDYTAEWIRKVLFCDETIGMITPSDKWTSEYLSWEEKNKFTKRTFQKNTGYELIQGSGKVTGRLVGGCIEVLQMAKQTVLWPEISSWEGAVLFLETSEDKPLPTYIEYWLRNYGIQGILNKISGIIWGKPYNNLYYEEYKQSISKIMK